MGAQVRGEAGGWAVESAVSGAVGRGPAARCGWEWLSRCGAARASLVWRCWAPHHVSGLSESGRAPAPLSASGRRVSGRRTGSGGSCWGSTLGAGEHAVGSHRIPLASPDPRLMPFGNGAAGDPSPAPHRPLSRVQDRVVPCARFEPSFPYGESNRKAVRRPRAIHSASVRVALLLHRVTLSPPVATRPVLLPPCPNLNSA